MNCVPNEHGECIACGRKLPTPTARRQCRGEAVPSLGGLVVSYGAAMLRWIAAGRPTRTQAEIDAILADQCGPCEHFRQSSCALCGCRISRSPSAMRNKLAMGTESCPIGKWQ